MWKYYAIAAAIFAAFTALLAKIGVKGIDSNLATAIRTVVILLLTWGIVFCTGGASKLAALTARNWVFLVLSGAATGLSWLFYFKALQTGDVSKVAPLDKLSVVFVIVLGIIFLREPVDPKVLAGGALILLGALVLVW